MRLMSDFRDAMWGLVQSAISPADYDFLDYAETHFARFEEAAAGPEVERWLEQARVVAK
jgi:hypothetical protein